MDNINQKNVKELLEIMSSKYRDNGPVTEKDDYPRITGGYLIAK